MRRAFSVIELLIVVGIATMVFSIVLFAFVNTKKDRSVKESADRLVSLLEEARSKTLAGEQNSSFGVRIAQNRLTLFVGTSYAEQVSNKVVVLPSGVVATSTIIGGGSDIVFERLSGSVSAYGTTTISLSDNSGKNLSVTISAAGIVAY